MGFEQDDPMSSTHPRVIKGADPTKIEIEWDDGHRTVYAARELRAICPCAQCVHELTRERMLRPEAIPADLTQTGIQMVGNYAVTVFFSDGHHLGIYTFPMLRENDPRGGA